MKKTLVLGVYMVLTLLAALGVSGCPVEDVEDEIPTSGSTIRLTNIPVSVLGGNNFGFFAVFSDKDKIGPRASLMRPLTGHIPGGLKLNPLTYWLKGGNSLEVSFGGAITGNRKYVLVLGLSPTMDESNGTTYTSNGPVLNEGGGDFSVAGDGPSIGDGVLVNFVGDVAEIDFSKNFKYTGGREDLLKNKGIW
jgi:hypothetical protein